MADWQMREKRPLRGPVRDEPGPALKNYITPAGLRRLKDEHLFLLSRERPAVVEVVAWAASNGDRSENADYLYGKRRLGQIDSRRRRRRNPSASPNSRLTIFVELALGSVTPREVSWSKSSSFWGMSRFRPPNAIWAASSGYDQRSMTTSVSSRILDIAEELPTIREPGSPRHKGAEIMSQTLVDSATPICARSGSVSE
jgi:hypothetical protein